MFNQKFVDELFGGIKNANIVGQYYDTNAADKYLVDSETNIYVSEVSGKASNNATVKMRIEKKEEGMFEEYKFFRRLPNGRYMPWGRFKTLPNVRCSPFGAMSFNTKKERDKEIGAIRATIETVACALRAKHINEIGKKNITIRDVKTTGEIKHDSFFGKRYIEVEASYDLEKREDVEVKDGDRIVYWKDLKGGEKAEGIVTNANPEDETTRGFICVDGNKGEESGKIISHDDIIKVV